MQARFAPSALKGNVRGSELDLAPRASPLAAMAALRRSAG
jgi:hypothetical protein